MVNEAPHIVDVYAYAVLRAACGGELSRTRLYLSNTHRRKLETMMDAGWIEEDPETGRPRTTDRG